MSMMFDDKDDLPLTHARPVRRSLNLRSGPASWRRAMKRDHSESVTITSPVLPTVPAVFDWLRTRVGGSQIKKLQLRGRKPHLSAFVTVLEHEREGDNESS